MRTGVNLVKGLRVAAGILVVVCVAAGAEKEAPAPVNPYSGTQKREEVFEFVGKPSVEKNGKEWVISFESKGNCDATVAIIDKDGLIIRHLASGVLGTNAPHPFRQGSLSQKLVWDGTNDQGNPVSEEILKACSARVSLGLEPEFERNIVYDPYEFGVSAGDKRRAGTMGGYLVGKGADDEVFVLGLDTAGNTTFNGRVFKKDGTFVRTFWPPSAGDMGKLTQVGYTTTKTEWGDSVLVIHQPLGLSPYAKRARLKLDTLADAGKVPFAVAGISDYKEEPRPAWLPAQTMPEPCAAMFTRARIRMAADRTREKLYICEQTGGPMMRFDGITGVLDPTWFPKGDLSRVSELAVGPDGNVYIGVGSSGYNEFIVKLDYEGAVIPFGGDAVPLPKKGTWVGGGGQYGSLEGKGIYGGTVCPRAFKKMGDVMALWTGGIGHSNTHERGMYISPRGLIVAAVQKPMAERAVKYGAPEDKVSKAGNVQTSYVAVWAKNGTFLTANAVGDMQNGHGVTMDRDGNIYAVLAGALPAGVNTLVGLTEQVPGGAWGGYGSILKFRGGIPFPRARSYNRLSRHNLSTATAPEDAVKVQGQVTAIADVDDALQWMYPGVVCHTTNPCTCHHLRYDMDYFARHWIPANYLSSVMVVDANANVIARVGRYGNPQDADPTCGKIHMAWPRALCVSDTALYVADAVARRVFKASIRYHAEEMVPLE